MHIDSYEFGKVVVDGTTYTSDCLIVGDCVHADWWRKAGHSLVTEDLESVVAAGPSVLVVGCGASGMMRVPEDTGQALKSLNIELIALDTQKAIGRFNDLAETGRNVAAALHLTC